MVSVNLDPIVILVHPQMGENIGATARAMKNFGLSRLRLVNPRDGWPNPLATATASGADCILENAQVFDTFAQAVSDCHFVYATTARSRELPKPTFSPASAVEQALKQEEHSQQIAFVFGAERSGLDNDVIALCHGIIHIPTNPEFWSLNLAQSVLLLSYEWFCQKHDHPLSDNKFPVRQENTPFIPDPAASHGEMMGLFEHLEQELEEKGFFRPDHKKDSMIRNLRTLLMKGQFTSNEVKTLRGVVRRLSR